MMEVMILLAAQCLLGAFDNFWHHELTEKLPSRVTARRELSLHAVREFLYAVVFIGVAWWRWEGAWIAPLIAILGVEVVVTLWDFVVEDETRRLPKLERITHTVLAINYGAILAVWTPELLSWVEARDGIRAIDYGFFSWMLTAAGIGVLIWSMRDAAAVIRLGVPEWQRRPFKAGQSAAPRYVLVTGATGFIGRAVTRALIERGDHVLVLTRDVSKARYQFGRHVQAYDDLRKIVAGQRIDAIVNLAGEALISGLWTKARRIRFLSSRVGTTRELMALIKRLDRKPDVLVSGSAVGYYGDRGDTVLDETSGGQGMFMSELCRRWEKAARQAEPWGIRVCRLRFGCVFGRGGGAFPPMALATRLGLGVVFGTGRQWLPWIHLDDLVRLILFAVDRPEVCGAINAVSPHLITNREFALTLGKILKRPVVMRAPAALTRLVLGEMADLVLASQRVMPRAAESLGFPFTFARLDEAAANLARSPAWHGMSRGGGLERVFYNDACPVCDGEIASYRTRAESEGRPIEFCPASTAPNALWKYGLDEADMRRRLYAVMRGGLLVSGVDAFVAIWAELPGFAWASRLLSTRGGRGLGVFVYDGLIVPSLAVYNRLRDRRSNHHVRHA